MKQVSGKALARAVEKKGWHAGSVVRLSIPIHGNRPLKQGLLKFLMKQAALGENDV